MVIKLKINITGGFVEVCAKKVVSSIFCVLRLSTLLKLGKRLAVTMKEL